MDIHKPKAAHSWREFLIEIGTIICGILIALGLEQGIETLHWRHEVETARKAFREELHILGTGALMQIDSWPCEQRRLDQLSAELRRARGTWKGSYGIDRGRRAAFIAPTRGWGAVTWDEYKSNGAVQHMPDEERTKFNFIFALIQTGMARFSKDQDDASAELAVLTDDLSLSDVTRENKLTAVEKARFSGYFLDSIGRTLVRRMAGVGVTFTAADHPPNAACTAKFTETSAAGEH